MYEVFFLKLFHTEKLASSFDAVFGLCSLYKMLRYGG